VGWVVGHSYIVYAPLFHGCTTVLYEGKPVGTPDPGAFWRVIAEYGVKTLFTAPTAFRAIKREDPTGTYAEKYDLSHFKALFLAGERCDPDTLHWAENLLNVPVIDHWWQTETGWPMVANPLGIEQLPVKAGSASKPVPGYDVRVIDLNDEEAAPEEIGDIVVKLPLPPGTLATLWQNDGGFIRSYLKAYDGYYLTSDAGYKDADGYVFIMSRTDDIINVAGHRLSTGGIEGVISAHPDVAECAVIGVNDDLKGALPFGLIVLKNGVYRDHDEIVQEVIQMVREDIGPVAAFKKAIVVERLPKTRSGKVLRGTMKQIADQEAWRMPATIDDPSILDEITDSLGEAGYGPKGQP
jgi:propionyl-CoA synthetase